MRSSSKRLRGLFRLLTYAFPRGHRHRFSREMVALFSQELSERDSRPGVWTYCLRACFGVVVGGLALRAEGRQRCRSMIPQPSPRPKKGARLMFSSWMNDVRFALRGLSRVPGFALVTVLTLALGIGANTAIFSIINAVLLRPLPFERPDELVELWEFNPPKGWDRNVAAPANFLDWKRQATVFQDMAAYSDAGFSAWTGRDEAIQVREGNATGNFFKLLGVRPALGRLFRDEETWHSENSVVVLSHGFWLRHFGGDPEVLGKEMILEGTPTEIVGVLKEDFRIHDADVEVWRPFGWDPKVIGVEVWTRRAHWISPIARLKPGVPLQQASAELGLIAKRLEEKYPNTNAHMGAGLTPLQEWVVGGSSTALWVLMAAVAAVLLIACANVANLLLARNSVRTREMAVRGALGAGRGRLLVQMLSESLLLALAGGFLGLVLALAGVAALKAAAPTDLPRLWEVEIDGGVLLFSLGVSLLTALICGLAPAWSSSRTELSAALQEGGRQMGLGGRGNLRRVLVAAEVALSVMLVIAAGLLLRSLLELRSVDPGFDPQRLLTFNMSLPGSRYSPEQSVTFFDQLVERLAGLPGVRSAAAASALPFPGGTWTSDSTIEGQEEYVREFRHRSVTPEYLDTMGAKLLEGRNFLDTDIYGAQPVVMINEAFAKHFQHAKPVGHRIKLAKPENEALWVTVVGVVQDEKFEQLDRPAPPQIYRPHAQRGERFMRVVLRTEGNPMDLADVVRAEVAAMDAELPVFSLRSMDQILSEALSRQRFLAQLVGLFAALALVLASVGVYGVLAYSVNQRTQEFGIRMALGAGRGDVLRLVLAQGMGTVAVGMVAGLAGAVVLNRFLSGVLFQVTSTDPRTFGSVAAALVVVALAACYLPARRAGGVDPNSALRAE